MWTLSKSLGDDELLSHEIENGKFVGAGEKTVYQIVKEFFPTMHVIKQVDYWDLMPPIDYIKEPYLKKMRQDKESVDIVICPELPKKLPLLSQDASKIICIRVQNTDHKGNLKCRIDSRQLRELAEIYTVVDIKWHEASELFQERNNEKSVEEVKIAFKLAGIIL